MVVVSCLFIFNLKNQKVKKINSSNRKVLMRKVPQQQWIIQSLATAGITSLVVLFFVNERPQVAETKAPVAAQHNVSRHHFKWQTDKLHAQADTPNQSMRENAPAFPYYSSNNSAFGHQIAALESQLEDLRAQVATRDNAHQTNGDKQVKHRERYGVCFSADLLYWKANEDGLEYGTKMVAGPLIGVSSKTKTKLLDLNFEWNAGFRLGLGYEFNHFDHWALGLKWTRMRSQAHGHAHAKGIEGQATAVNTIIPTWVNLVFELRAGASSAQTSWHLDYDTLDLDLARSYLASNKLALTPFVGVRAAWINQRYLAKYNSVFLLSEGAEPFKRKVTFEGKNDFSSFGLRAGSGLVWNLSNNWNIFGNLSGSLLYGQFNVSMKNKNDQGLGEGAIPPMPLDFTAREEFWRIRLNFEESLGIGWGMFFKHQKYHIGVNAAYEMSQWLSQNELFYTLYFRGDDTISSVPIRNQGNLSFQGIRAGIQFDF